MRGSFSALSTRRVLAARQRNAVEARAIEQAPTRPGHAVLVRHAAWAPRSHNPLA